MFDEADLHIPAKEASCRRSRLCVGWFNCAGGGGEELHVTYGIWPFFAQRALEGTGSLMGQEPVTGVTGYSSHSSGVKKSVTFRAFTAKYLSAG